MEEQLKNMNLEESLTNASEKSEARGTNATSAEDIQDGRGRTNYLPKKSGNKALSTAQNPRVTRFMPGGTSLETPPELPEAVPDEVPVVAERQDADEIQEIAPMEAEAQDVQTTLKPTEQSEHSEKTEKPESLENTLCP